MRAIASIILALAVGFLSLPARAQTVALTAITADLVIKDVLKSFEATANRLLLNGAQQGDLLATKFGNQLNVAIQNVSIAAGDQMDRQIKKATPELRNALDELNRIVEVARDTSGMPVKLEEIAKIDLIALSDILASTVGQETIPFYLSSVDGLTQVRSEGDYKLTFRGYGFGFEQGSRTYAYRIIAKDYELSKLQINAIDDKTTELIIPHGELEKFFDQKKTVTLPIRFVSTISQDRRCLIKVFCRGRDTRSFEVPFTISLLPLEAVELKGTQSVKRIVSDGQDRVRPIVFAFPADTCTSKRPCDAVKTEVFANDEVIDRVDFRQDGSGCAFSYPVTTAGSGPDVSISPDRKTITAYRHYDGEDGPCTVTHDIHYHKMVEQVSEESVTSIPARFGELFNIDLDISNPNCSYALSGKLVTGQDIYIDSGMTSSADGLLQRVSSTQLGGSCRVSFILRVP